MYNYLPKSNSIDTQRLGRLFDDKAESYKLFWFQAIVQKVYEGKLSLSFDTLINEMIADGWYMVSEYKLNLGPKDTLEKAIQLAYGKEKLKSSEKKEIIISTLENSHDKELRKKKVTLTDQVPYRLQAPFLDDIKGDVWKKVKKSPDLINKHDNLLYCISEYNGLDSKITITEEFADYIKRNYKIICGWIKLNMVEYLQKRNPAVPGIVNKIDPPQARNLEKVKKYWKEIIRVSDIHDIYDNEELKGKTISIDHFVPWSYVAHDELWNLTPTTRSINSSKSNNLPKWDQYFDKLSQSEYKAYCLKNEYDYINKLFEECRKDHVNDIDVYQKLYRNDLSQLEFHNRLKDVVEPVYIAAKNLGFSEWSI